MKILVIEIITIGFFACFIFPNHNFAQTKSKIEFYQPAVEFVEKGKENVDQLAKEVEKVKGLINQFDSLDVSADAEVHMQAQSLLWKLLKLSSDIEKVKQLTIFPHGSEEQKQLEKLVKDFNDLIILTIDVDAYSREGLNEDIFLYFRCKTSKPAYAPLSLLIPSYTDRGAYQRALNKILMDEGTSFQIGGKRVAIKDAIKGISSEYGAIAFLEIFYRSELTRTGMTDYTLTGSYCGFNEMRRPKKKVTLDHYKMALSVKNRVQYEIFKDVIFNSDGPEMSLSEFLEFTKLITNYKQYLEFQDYYLYDTRDPKELLKFIQRDRKNGYWIKESWK